MTDKFDPLSIHPPIRNIDWSHEQKDLTVTMQQETWNRQYLGDFTSKATLTLTLEQSQILQTILLLQGDTPELKNLKRACRDYHEKLVIEDHRLKQHWAEQRRRTDELLKQMEHIPIEDYKMPALGDLAHSTVLSDLLLQGTGVADKEPQGVAREVPQAASAPDKE